MGIEADDEVHLADVQSLLPDTRGHQRVVATLAESPDNLTRGRVLESSSLLSLETCRLVSFPAPTPLCS